MPQEPQIPIRHEYRNASPGSTFSLTQRRASRTVIPLATGTRNVVIRGSSPTAHGLCRYTLRRTVPGAVDSLGTSPRTVVVPDLRPLIAVPILSGPREGEHDRPHAPAEHDDPQDEGHARDRAPPSGPCTDPEEDVPEAPDPVVRRRMGVPVSPARARARAAGVVMRTSCPPRLISRHAE